MSTSPAFPLEGGCDCGSVRYRIESVPLFVHSCHCRWCQRETGSAFALNALIESDRVTHLAEEPEITLTPSKSGRGQKIARCPYCKIAVWSSYRSPLLRYIRVGTLDQPEHITPDIHIYIASKQPWVMLPQGVPAVEEFYKIEEYWPPSSLKRWQALVTDTEE